MGADDSNAVSSAKVAGMVVSVGLGRSVVKRIYKKGPSTPPCGTPAWIGWRGDEAVP